DLRVRAERAAEAVQRRRTPPRIATRQRELEVHERAGRVLAPDEALSLRWLIEHRDERRRRLDRAARFALERRRRATARRALRLAILGPDRGADPLDRAPELRLRDDPGRGARRCHRAIAIDLARDAEALRARDRFRFAADLVEP